MSAIAEHYADALALVAIAQNSADQVRKELSDFATLESESPELHILLSSPAVARSAKHGVAEMLVARMGASRTLRNFLFVIIDHGRMRLLQEIQLAFDAQIDKRRGIARVQVTSADELGAEEKDQLRAALEQLSGQHVEAEYRLDPAVIGGTVVRMGDTIYDGTLRTQLERMREQLAIS